jgi:hypothetical protein
MLLLAAPLRLLDIYCKDVSMHVVLTCNMQGNVISDFVRNHAEVFSISFLLEVLHPFHRP